MTRSSWARPAVRIVGNAVGVLVGAATAAFLAQTALPGDRATAILNIRAGQAELRTPEELAPITAEFGLDRPLWQQYADYLLGLVRGDLGTSYLQFRPVGAIIGEQLGATVVLAITAIAIAWMLMVVWIVATGGRGPRLTALGSLVDVTTAALPAYWLGIILLLVFALGLGWFPVLGDGTPLSLVLPALTLAIPLAGFLAQATRTEFERALEQPFALSARMRGQSDLGVRLGHVLRHASLPAISLSGWALGATLSGAVVVESIFSRPGIGQVLVSAVSSQDLPVVVGVVVLTAAFYVAANLLVDLASALVDPRQRAA
ncbi:ABC transporter permease [Microcella alkalica]|uniref:Peptide/nickel transport system permease protein n=1 Tax=Microcella alkalica TaxID=355930 RepID=A0A839EGL9_9MICO|nr:ABC transporter permease [Microcella alkalica]MBA8848465.1 peptide/nickel transport system permease protein [Microcella alkalica]